MPIVKIIAAIKKPIPAVEVRVGLQKLAAQKKAVSWTVMQKAMQMAFFIFFDMNLQNQMDVSLQQILIRPTIMTRIITASQILPILMILLMNVYYVKNTGVVISPVTVRSSHPQLQGVMLLIYMQRKLCRQQMYPLMNLKQEIVWMISNIFVRTRLLFLQRGIRTNRSSMHVQAS